MMYVHIGMPKTGTTFLQREVFPKWKQIEYINGHLIDLIARKKGIKYLISNEGLVGRPWVGKNQEWSWYEDQELFLKNLKISLPEAKIIIGFRRHDNYILSLYRQYLHEGGVLDFKEFFDIETDTGVIKKRDLFFRHTVELIEKHFNQKPFVFLQEELQENLSGFLKDLELFFGEESPNKRDLINGKKNIGVGYYQSKLLRRLNLLSKSKLNPNGFLPLYHRHFRKFRIDPRTICQRWLAFISSRAISLSEKKQKGVLDYYKTDWNYILTYSKLRRMR